jgi:bacterioferritin-associated ferredoxin
MDEELRDLIAEAERLLNDVLHRGTGDAMTSLLAVECAHTLRDLKEELAAGTASSDCLEDAMLVLSALEETLGRDCPPPPRNTLQVLPLLN